MKKQTIYIADDGTHFNDEAMCMQYEALCEGISNAMKPLGKRPSGGSFYNSGLYYVQHTDVVLAVVDNVITAIHQFTASDRIKANTVLTPASNRYNIISWVRRELMENEIWITPNRALSRLLCINLQSYREYGQPFFAQNEWQARDKAIEPL